MLHSHDDNKSLVSSRRGLNDLTQLWFHSWIKDDTDILEKGIALVRTRLREHHGRLRGEASLQACDGVFGVLTFPLMCSSRTRLRAISVSPWKKTFQEETWSFSAPPRPPRPFSVICLLFVEFSVDPVVQLVGDWTAGHHATTGFFPCRVPCLLPARHLRESAWWAWKRPNDGCKCCFPGVVPTCHSLLSAPFISRGTVYRGLAIPELSCQGGFVVVCF